MTSKTYKQGDKLVHPKHGVGTVAGPPTEASDGRTYVQMFFERAALTIMLPLDSISEIGIRKLATVEDVDRILATLSETSDVSTEWSERNAETVARVKSTDLDQAALVVRDLTLHGQRAEKPLSAAEKGALDACIATVAQELAVVLDMSEDEARALIQSKIGPPPGASDDQGGDAPVAV